MPATSHNRRRGALTLAFIPLTLVSSAASGQRAQRVDRSDYARADSVFNFRRAGLLKNGLVIPHWLGPTDQFWYRRETAAGSEFPIVDAATGRKRMAFDARTLAAALGKASGERIAADSLPLDSMTVAPEGPPLRDPTAACLTVKGKGFRCPVAPGEPTCESIAPPPDRALSLSPDRRVGVFTRDGNLILRDLGTGAERPLTSDGVGKDYGYGIYPDGIGMIPRLRAEAAGRPAPPAGVVWSPDSRTIVVPLVDQRTVGLYPFMESVPADGSFRPKVHLEHRALIGETASTQQLFLIDVTTGATRPLEFPTPAGRTASGSSPAPTPLRDDPGFRRTWWSADNRHLYALAHHDNEEVASLYDIEVGTGRVRLVLEERGAPRLNLNTTDYNLPNVHVGKDGKDVIWWSQRDGWGHLYRYDGTTGALANRITEGPWLVRDIVAVDETRRLVYFTAGGREPGNPYYRHLHRVGFDGTGLTLLSPEPGDHTLTGPGSGILPGVDGAVGYSVISPSGKYLVYNVSTPSQPTATVIRKTADGKLVAEFEKADPTGLYAAGYRPPEEFTVKAADGVTDLWGLLYKPATFDSTIRYPVIDAEYTSPIIAVVPRSFLAAVVGPPGSNGAAFAQLGFISVVIDSRGTPFRSREFGQAMYGKLGTMGLDDHIAAIKQLGRRYGFVDTTRVGITGGSFGGWSAIRALLEYPEFFKVGFAGSAPGAFHNMYTFAGYQGRPAYSNGTELIPAPTEVPRNYASIDSRQQVSRFQGKLLMTVSELDENVLPGSTLQLVDALLKADKDVDVIYLPDAPHGYGRYTGHVVRRMWDYFVRNLIGVEPPAYRLRFP